MSDLPPILFQPVVEEVTLPPLPTKDAYRIWKRIMDVGLCLVVSPLLIPLLLLIALAIGLDSSGPIFFRQYRYGQHGKPFRIYKFRTMYAADCRVMGGKQVCRDDPRITRVGRLLRKSSFDELPQVLNILRGEMSLVGPRPHAVEHHHFYVRQIPDYRHRLTVKPGLTGWAQINGCRGETKRTEQMLSRVHYDLDYIRKRNLWLDFQIILLTFGVILDSNAY